MIPGKLLHVEGLGRIPGIEARFLGRIPGVDVDLPRDEAMAVLEPIQLGILSGNGLDGFPLIRAEQVHGREVAWIGSPVPSPVGETDGLATSTRGITLGISVADCAPVWIVARDGSAGALLHSGKKGTERGITREGIRLLTKRTAKEPEEFVTVIGPCIRPPCYEVDFAKDIARQSREEGVEEVYDEGVCTACRPELYYSYRREGGLTGRMLATLTLLPVQGA